MHTNILPWKLSQSPDVLLHAIADSCPQKLWLHICWFLILLVYAALSRDKREKEHIKSTDLNSDLKWLHKKKNVKAKVELPGFSSNKRANVNLNKERERKRERKPLYLSILKAVANKNW